MHLSTRCAMCLLVLGTGVLSQSPAAVPAPSSVARTFGDIAKRLRANAGGKLRVVDRGALRQLTAAEELDPAGDLLLLQPGPTRTVEADQRKFTTLPFKLQLVDARTLAVRELWPVIHPERESLEFDTVARAFVGRVLVGLVDDNGVGLTTQLPEQLTLELVTNVGFATPRSVPITHIGPPFATVALSVTDEAPEVRLSILWGVEAADAVHRSFALHRPRLDVTVSPDRIAGFGLSVADVVVHAPGAGARGAKTAIVSHDRGRLEGTQQVALDDQGFGIAHLRSVGVGVAKVRVTVPTFEPDEETVAFHWPFAFVVSAILGGLLGGFVRFVRAHRKRRAVAEMLRSTSIGLVVAVASAVGINLLGIQVTAGFGEGVVFVIAALGAMYGIRLPGNTPPAPTPAPS
jgi:hypothetical protein